MTQQTITLGGITYDAQTGLPLEKKVAAARESAHKSSEMHAHVQRSTTLNRKIAAKHTRAMRPDIARPATKPGKHPLVTKFADVTPAKKTRLGADTTLITPVDITPQAHPLVAKAAIKSAPAKKTATAGNLSSHQIKQHAIAQSLRDAPSHNAPHKTKLHKAKKTPRVSRRLSFVAGGFALLLLAAYFTYLNMPALSMRVAAAQAGINATYPGYQPDGYTLSGPIAYNTGEVSLKFAANGGPQSYTLTQVRSDWDNTAVDQNYAQAKWGDDVSTIQTNGLTIYEHGSDAAWVNGGILYTIDGNAPLSQNQITHLATSM